MIYKVDLTKEAYRWLFQPLYNRVLQFGLEHDWTPVDVHERFIRLLTQDPNLHLLIALSEDTKITAHCLLNIMSPNIIMEQVQDDIKKGSTFASEVLEYTDMLSKEHPDLKYLIGITTRKELKAMEKHYGFSLLHHVVRRELKSLTPSQEES